MQRVQLTLVAIAFAVGIGRALWALLAATYQAATQKKELSSEEAFALLVDETVGLLFRHKVGVAIGVGLSALMLYFGANWVQAMAYGIASAVVSETTARALKARVAMQAAQVQQSSQTVALPAQASVAPPEKSQLDLFDN